MMPDGRGPGAARVPDPGARPDRLPHRVPDRDRGHGHALSQFDGYAPRASGDDRPAHNGVLVSTVRGKAIAYALFNLQERGALFIGHGDAVYEGMIVGMHSRDNDLVVNPTKGKKLTNIRAAGSRREHHPHAADQDDARAGAGVHRRRRARRGHADQRSGCARSCSTENERKREAAPAHSPASRAALLGAAAPFMRSRSEGSRPHSMSPLRPMTERLIARPIAATEARCLCNGTRSGMEGRTSAANDNGSVPPAAPYLGSTRSWLRPRLPVPCNARVASAGALAGSGLGTRRRWPPSSACEPSQPAPRRALSKSKQQWAAAPQRAVPQITEPLRR